MHKYKTPLIETHIKETDRRGRRSIASYASASMVGILSTLMFDASAQERTPESAQRFISQLAAEKVFWVLHRLPGTEAVKAVADGKCKTKIFIDVFDGYHLIEWAKVGTVRRKLIEGDPTVVLEGAETQFLIFTDRNYADRAAAAADLLRSECDTKKASTGF